MNIVEAFKTAKEGSFIKHPNLHNIIYARKSITGSIVLYEKDTHIPLDLIITEDILDSWEKVTCKDFIEDVENNNI
jgi:hypothetical protein